MATISNTPRPGYAWDATDNVWYPIGTGTHGHPDYITQATAISPTLVDAKGDIIAASAADTVARLAVGANDTVLTADSSTATGLKWATPAAGGQTLISTTTLTGASITLSSIPQTYKHLRVLVQGVYGNTAGGALGLRLNADTTNSNYWSVWNGGGSSYSINVQNGNQSFMYFCHSQDATAFERRGSAVLDLHRYTDTAAPQYVSGQGYSHSSGTGTGPYNGRIVNGIYNKSAAITSLTVLVDSGTMTAGTVYLYGVS